MWKKDIRLKKRKFNYFQINIIKEHINADFDIENPVFPVRICQRDGTLFFKISTDPTKDMNQNRPILTYLVLGMLQQKAELKWYVYPISLCPGEYELILKGSYNYFLQNFPHGIKY